MTNQINIPKNRSVMSILIFFLCTTLFPLTSIACSTFSINSGGWPIVGKNYDWMTEKGLVFINKRGVSKTANADGRDDFKFPAKWVSKYGSITFNQHGRELPLGGMNEAGLVVESLVLKETIFPSSDSRPSISLLQWVQYQLDVNSTIEEVIKSDSKIRIPTTKSGIGIHYFVCDKSGQCAAIEFIGGKMVYYEGDSLPVKVMTNSTYESSAAYWQLNGLTKLLKFNFSLNRFSKASNLVTNFKEDNRATSIDYSFEILREIKQHLYYRTRWSIVYDTKNQKVFFKTSNNPNIRNVDLNEFDLSCENNAMVLDINANWYGDVTDKFVAYSYEINRDLIRDVYQETPFLRNVKSNVVESRSRYPESTMCSQ